MPTLFLLAPHSRNQTTSSHKDFYSILASGVGPDYGISANLIAQVGTGMPAIVFDRDRRLEPEGIVTGYTPTDKAGNGVQRYNVSNTCLQRSGHSSHPMIRCQIVKTPVF